MTDVYAPYYKKLAQLTAKRDEVNARIAPMLAELEVKNLAAEEARLAAETLAKEISDLRGGQAWLDLKKEIGALSKMLTGARPAR